VSKKTEKRKRYFFLINMKVSKYRLKNEDFSIFLEGMGRKSNFYTPDL
jgi:hypothetical protein